MKHVELDEFPCNPSLPESLMGYLEQGTRWSHSPFSGAASRDREGFPFCWEVELFGSLTHAQSQGLGIQRQLRAGIDVTGVTAPLSKHRQSISLQKCFENWMSLEFSVHKTIWNEERRDATSLFQHGTGPCFNRNSSCKGLSASWSAQDLRIWEPPGSKSRNQEKNKQTSQPTQITTGVAKVNLVFNNYCCGLREFVNHIFCGSFILCAVVRSLL